MENNMGLFKPTPGEMVDRQTILTLKVEFIQSQGDSEEETIANPSGEGTKVITRSKVTSKLSSHHFVDELEQIRTRLLTDWIPPLEVRGEDKVGLYDRLYDDLMDVNSQLWDLEDKARVLRDAPSSVASDVLFQQGYDTLCNITRLNDKRAELVKSINALWEIPTLEKLHQ